MSTSSQAEEVRRQVRHAFLEQGVDPAATMCESILIRGGFLCGRRFEQDGLGAIWFAEERQLKFFDRDGALLEINCGDEAFAMRQAA